MQDSKPKIQINGDTVDYVAIDEIVTNAYCHQCGSFFVNRETCHVRCNKCGYISEGCGD